MNRVCSASAAYSVRAALIALVVLVCASLAFGQSDLGTISGFVKDPSGAVVPKAQVTVKNELTGLERAVTTNDSGFYTVTNIPAGFYGITVAATGFKRYESTHNKLDPSATLAIDVPIAVGAATETVEVWQEPGRSRRVGAGRSRRQRRRPQLLIRPGPVEFQRLPEPGKSDHL